MPTQTYLQNAQADSATDVMPALLTISHADLATPIRLVANTVDITSRGNLFTAYGFDFIAPGQSEMGVTPAKIGIDNIDKRIVETCRALATPPTMLIEIVLASAPNTVEESFPVFTLNTVSGDRYQLTADLSEQDDDGEALVQWDYSPATAPGLFSG